VRRAKFLSIWFACSCGFFLSAFLTGRSVHASLQYWSCPDVAYKRCPLCPPFGADADPPVSWSCWMPSGSYKTCMAGATDDGCTNGNPVECGGVLYLALDCPTEAATQIRCGKNYASCDGILY
jgi:hypothetical protein